MSDWTKSAAQLVPRPERRQVATRRIRRLGGRRECDMPFFAVTRADADGTPWDPFEYVEHDRDPLKHSVH